VLGKLESALSYVLLLLFAAIPLQSIAFLFGGVGELELVLAFIILLVTAITLGTVGIYFSTQASRTLSASVRAYSTTLVVTFAVPLILSIVLTIVTAPLRTLSPAVEAGLIYVDDFLRSMNPITAALFSRQQLVENQVLGFFRESGVGLLQPYPRFGRQYYSAGISLDYFHHHLSGGGDGAGGAFRPADAEGRGVNERKSKQMFRFRSQPRDTLMSLKPYSARNRTIGFGQHRLSNLSKVSILSSKSRPKGNLAPWNYSADGGVTDIDAVSSCG